MRHVKYRFILVLYPVTSWPDAGREHRSEFQVAREENEKRRERKRKSYVDSRQVTTSNSRSVQEPEIVLAHLPMFR